MKLLALDTSSLACSVALLCEDSEFIRHEEQEREHTRLLMPMIRSVLAEARLEPRELDAIVLGNGPGSFIGMRIAASVTMGLAYAAGLPVVPISSLAAVAADVGKTGDSVVVTQDAHMQQVYLGMFERRDGGLVTALVPERLQSQVEIAELTSAKNYIAAGYGWQRYPALLELNQASLVSVSDRHYPAASALLRLGAADYNAGKTIGAREIEPTYLRETVAQIPSGPAS
ncbi:MAG TPA: tRNA (adenosine(37)-N6)-threonylcarbamoyltransferase complex dimerization subunit type 1 TsaB [Woeseiaceae bacterium]|nr:tRNA (adenosine(37)-N6)-threonylcarbamoyltransferase complex dimerization subunit type 1 TsaB [Woeseiaceae bacterium]